MEGKSDGVATSLMVLAMEEAGVPTENPQLNRGLSWLLSNQNEAEGFWPASSVNKRRHQSSDTVRFMSDAATAFAVLALAQSHATTNPTTSASSLETDENRSRFSRSAAK
jgi:squalene-hopene/tetraprenyl-beta-curcumene cyclase